MRRIAIHLWYLLIQPLFIAICGYISEPPFSYILYVTVLLSFVIYFLSNSSSCLLRLNNFVEYLEKKNNDEDHMKDMAEKIRIGLLFILFGLCLTFFIVSLILGYSAFFLSEEWNIKKIYLAFSALIVAEVMHIVFFVLLKGTLSDRHWKRKIFFYSSTTAIFIFLAVL